MISNRGDFLALQCNVSFRWQIKLQASFQEEWHTSLTSPCVSYRNFMIVHRMEIWVFNAPSRIVFSSFLSYPHCDRWTLGCSKNFSKHWTCKHQAKQTKNKRYLKIPKWSTSRLNRLLQRESWCQPVANVGGFCPSFELWEAVDLGHPSIEVGRSVAMDLPRVFRGKGIPNGKSMQHPHSRHKNCLKSHHWRVPKANFRWSVKLMAWWATVSQGIFPANATHNHWSLRREAWNPKGLKQKVKTGENLIFFF